MAGGEGGALREVWIVLHGYQQLARRFLRRFQPIAEPGRRIVAPEAVALRAPEVIIASWCGKKVVPSRIMSRPGWQDIPAIRAGRVHEVKSPLILQPGPAALTDGLDAILAALWPGEAD